MQRIAPPPRIVKADQNDKIKKIKVKQAPRLGGFNRRLPKPYLPVYKAIRKPHSSKLFENKRLKRKKCRQNPQVKKEAGQAKA